MKKKASYRGNQRSGKLKYLVPGAGIVGLVLFLVLTQNPLAGKDPNIWFEDGFGELAIAKNQILSCGGYTEATQYFPDGTKQLYGTKVTTTFNVFKPLDVLSMRYGKTIDKIRIAVNSFCDPVNGVKTAFLVGGSVTTTVSFRGDDGTYQVIKTSTVQLPTVSQNLLTPRVIQSVDISIAELKSKLTTTKPQVIGPLTVETTVSLKVKTDLTGSTVNTVSFKTSMGDTIKITNDKLTNPAPGTQTTSQAIGSRVTLTTIIWNLYATSDIALEYDRAETAISAVGELDKWSDAEGVPYIKLIGPDGKVINSKIPMTSSIKKIVVNGKESANDYEFKATNIRVPGVSGKYTLEMHSANDIRKSTSGKPLVSIKEFVVHRAAAPPTSPPPTTNDPTITVEKASLVDGFFRCEIIFDGDKENCVVGNVPTFPVIKPDQTASLIRSADTTQKTLVEITIDPALDFKKTRVDSITNMKLQQKFQVLVNDNDVGLIQTNSATLGLLQGNLFAISKVNIQGVKIEEQIKKNGISLIDGDEVKIRLSIDGTFDAILSGSKKQGVIKDMIFEYPLIFKDKDKLTCPEGQVRENNICVDEKTGTGSAGYCEGLSDAECIDKGKEQPQNKKDTPGTGTPNIGGVIIDTIESAIGGSSDSKGLQEKAKPGGSGGTNGLCDPDVTDCSTVLDSLGGSGSFLIIAMFMIFIFIVFIMIVVSLMKRKRN